MSFLEKDDYYYEIKPKSTLSLNIKELLEYKELFYYFTLRDLKVKYKQTALGFLWVILQPLLLMFIFTFFIGKSLAHPAAEMAYPVFVFSGLIIWLIFSSGVTNAGNSMVTNAQIIKKIYFPRLIIPISSILVSLFDFIMAFIVFIPLLFFFNASVNIGLAFLFWPLAILSVTVTTLGLGCLLAALNIKYRDFRYVIPFLVQALLFVTPVIYPLAMKAPEWVNYLIAANPMYGAIVLFRVPLSAAHPDVVLLTISLLFQLFFFVMGLMYFRKTEMYFADLA